MLHFILTVLLAATFTNPILYADYSDPDAIRVGDRYYMTSSSFNCSPGLQIMESTDMVHWQIIDAALPHAIPGGTGAAGVEHGNQVWAPSIREHDGMLYIYYGDPDVGIYCVRGNIGKWEQPVLVMPGKGLIDATPLWDIDGRCYLVHALAGSRAGHKSVLLVAELTPDGLSVLSPSRIIFDGHEKHPTCEGPKFYQRNGYYYIFTPAGGVPTGWQLVLRSKDVYGPYEEHIALAQGKTTVNGPHQGAWVTTPSGEDWFYHFQDVGALGRIVHLQPMKWIEDWPVIGDPMSDNPLCGQPVAECRMPDTGNPELAPEEIALLNTINGSDRFSTTELGLQWQWQRQPEAGWYFLNPGKYMRLYSVPQADQSYPSLWQQPNCLLQKTASPNPKMTAQVSFTPDKRYVGERAGLVLMGMDYAALVLENTIDGIVLRMVTCHKADRGGREKSIPADSIVIQPGQNVWLRVNMESGEPLPIEARRNENDSDIPVTALFQYSLDGHLYRTVGDAFPVKEGKWIGAKFGLFCSRPDIRTNDGGWLDVIDVSVR